jgi:hypothetical protein
VIGLGDETNGNPQLLNQMAQSGGTEKYYQTSGQDDLSQAMKTIAGSVSKCQYKLDQPPSGSDLKQLFVAFDNQVVAQDPQSGWLIDVNTLVITFHGASCDQLRSGSVHNVAISYGCVPVQ